MSRELLFSVTVNDLEIQTFRSGGPGGQNQNKRDSGVRIIHHPSGARGESREERSQLQNKRLALRKMASTPVFRYWVHQHARELAGEQSIEKWVEEQMADMSNIRVEYKDEDGNWTVVE